jgi:hypothetical protein
LRSDPGVYVDADAGCGLVGALVAALVPVIGTVLGAGWLAGVAGVAGWLAGVAGVVGCPAAVLGAIGAALDVPDDCGGTWLVAGGLPTLWVCDAVAGAVELLVPPGSAERSALTPLP